MGWGVGRERLSKGEFCSGIWAGLESVANAEARSSKEDPNRAG